MERGALVAQNYYQNLTKTNTWSQVIVEQELLISTPDAGIAPNVIRGQRPHVVQSSARHVRCFEQSWRLWKNHCVISIKIRLI